VKTPEILPLRTTMLTVAAVVLLTGCCAAQEKASTTPPDDNASLRDLDSQVRELRATIEQMRAENAESRAAMQELRQELRDTRKLLAPLAAAANGGGPVSPAPQTNSENQQAAAATPPAAQGTSETSASDASPQSDLADRVQKLEESAQLLGSKINEQYQTKVETASRYRARLSGIVLMNAFRNVGASDNLDLPDYAQPVAPGSPATNFGATLRQSEIGLELFGPTVMGAKSSANVLLDFAGGFPATANGVNFGIARLQTGTARLDWEHTAVIAGQDSLFISPLSPTSFASLAIPAFAYAGNLWGWTPQIRVEHRFDLADQETLTLQAGIMDNLNWEFPGNSYERTAQSGEASGQPAYALRTAWSRPVFDHPLTLGVAGYFGRQDWSFDRYVDAWGGMTDWRIPIVRRLGLSGEFYRGRGIGGLGAGIGRAVLFGAPSGSTTPIRGLDSAGGWTQLKLQLTSKLEVNGVFAEDDAFSGDIRGFATDANNFFTILGRNRGQMGNIVYRPRSDLLLSAEFRRLHTFPIYSAASTTNQVNLAMGLLF
jgi:hypothetical protein